MLLAPLAKRNGRDVVKPEEAQTELLEVITQSSRRRDCRFWASETEAGVEEGKEEDVEI